MDKCKRCQEKLEIGFARNGFTHCGWCANVELFSEQEENAGLSKEVNQQAAEIERLRELLGRAKELWYYEMPNPHPDAVALRVEIDQALAQRGEG